MSACNVGDLGSISVSGRFPGEGNGNPLQYIAWKIPWMGEPDRLQSMGSQRVGHNWATSLLHKFSSISGAGFCFCLITALLIYNLHTLIHPFEVYHSMFF